MSITIRNLTSTPLSIKSVENFIDPKSLQSSLNKALPDLKTSPTTSPLEGDLSIQAGSFQSEDLDIVLDPYASYCLSHHGARSQATTSPLMLRLTIELPDGTRYRIDVNPSYTQKSSQKLVSLSQDPTMILTGLFHPTSHTGHLSILSSDQQNSPTWMSMLLDSLPLSAVSIPGTHNSHTYYRALPSVRCQVVDIKAQLENGIRFLDIRLQPSHATDVNRKDLILVHGAFPISLTGPKYFEPLLQLCYDFLAAHPSETILISLKREGIGGAKDEHLSRILMDHYINPNASKWHIGETIPKLGAVRGKLVLIRRYKSSQLDMPQGLDATAWPNSPSHALFPSSVPTFCLQDFCDVLEPSLIKTKIQYSNEHLVRAAACSHQVTGSGSGNSAPSQPLYLNFLSGSNFWRKACWPENIAKVLNRGMEEWLCTGHHLQDPETTPREPTRGSHEAEGAPNEIIVRKVKSGDGGTGVVIMDCVGENRDWDLVRLVVAMNMGVVMKWQDNA